MDIKKKFLQLTSKTYPHGTENELKSHLPTNYQMDEFGNFYIEIGDNSTTLFTCHLDTADRKQMKVKHFVNGHIISTDGSSILGADDKAGMCVLLHMIENKTPGLYYFFVGEERGCVGSSKLAKKWPQLEWNMRITKCVSFDRRGTDSVITEQLYGTCCSTQFAKELSGELNRVEPSFNFKPDPTGIYTDSAQFTGLISECTNISVGYQSEHTTRETQNIEHLIKLCHAVTKIDWDSLSVYRKPSVYSLDDYGFSDYEETHSELNFNTSNFTWVNHGGKVRKMMISDVQIEIETKIISDFFGDASGFNWDGHNLYGLTCSGESYFISNRNELMEYIDELKQVPADHLKSF